MSTSIKPKFIPSKVKGKEGVICLQLIHSRKVKLLRTRFRLHLHEWENLPERIKTGVTSEIQTIRGLIRLLEIQGDYSLKELAELYKTNSFNGYLFPFIDFFVKNLIDSNRRKTASILLTAKRSFERFLSGRDILLDSIDNDLMRKYENWLKNEGVIKNTASCYMRALRSAYNQAVRLGLTEQKSPFADVYTGIDKTIKRAVNEEVIIQLKNLDLSNNFCLALARDLFLFSFYMRGMSFVDMANLRKGNLKNGYIVYTRSKTKQTLTVKIEDCMQEIIKRYERQTIDDYLLPIYTVQNRDNTSRLRNHNKRLKRISEMLGLEKLLSSYVARHTWATIALRKGVSIEIISESMGHENETTTRIYLASLGQSVVDKVNAEIIRLE
jgi:site-specific recombinase XerD